MQSYYENVLGQKGKKSGIEVQKRHNRKRQSIVIHTECIDFATNSKNVLLAQFTYLSSVILDDLFHIQWFLFTRILTKKNNNNKV